MAKIEIIAKWLKDSAGKIVVPKTYASCVYDAKGQTVEAKMADLQSQINAGGGGAGDGNAFELTPVFLGVDYVERTAYDDTKISVSITLTEDCKDIYFVAGMTDGDNNNDNYFQDVIAENVMMMENKRTFYSTVQSNPFTDYLTLYSSLLNAAEILNIPQPSPYYAFAWKYYLKEGKAGTTYTFTKQKYGKDVFVFAYALNKNGEILKFKTLT